MNTQNNTRPPGPFQIKAGETLTNKEGRILKLSHSGGAPQVVLPNDLADVPDYLLLNGGASGEDVKVEALNRDKAVRVRLTGTCNPGDELTHAAIDGTNDGAVRTLPIAADTYFVFLRAEEAGVDGQLVLARPILNPRAVVVTE